MQSFSVLFSTCVPYLTSGNLEVSHFPWSSGVCVLQTSGRWKEVIFFVVQPLRVGKVRKARFPARATGGTLRHCRNIAPALAVPVPVLYNPPGVCHSHSHSRAA
jgi:hypothetical protein